MFFRSKKPESQLTKYAFDQYDLGSESALSQAKQDVLSVAKILLSESINHNKDLRFDAGYFLSEWMSSTPDYSFGTGNLKYLLGGKPELATISMAAQIKYCLENNSDNSHFPEPRLGIWKLISNYVAEPKNKVKMTKDLKKLVKAHQENRLANFLEIGE